MSNEARKVRPSDDEVEVSIFGPGVGECIVAHVGQGLWGVVDSFRDPDTGDPIALRYLRDILGIDVATQVRFVVMSHWHDDHVRGAATLLEACSAATFWCSDALRSDEFLELVEASGRQPVRPSAAIAEFREILEILQGRGVTPEWLVADRRCFLESGGPFSAEMWALSPSSAAIARAKIELASLFPRARQPKARIVKQDANDVAAAILISLDGGQYQILLGSDLETRASDQLGWRAVVKSTGRPREASHLFKVAHHGSSNAHLDEIWTQLLRPAPLAVVAPYGRGATPRPTDSDLVRIKSRAGRAFITTARNTFGPRPRKPAVEAQIRATAISRRALWGTDAGHVRVRQKIRDGGPPSVELFAKAKEF